MHSSFINSLSLAALPRHRVQARAMLLEAGSETDRVFLLKKGRARGADGVVYQEGHVLNFKEFLAASHFLTPIKAQTECDVVHIPRDTDPRAPVHRQPAHMDDCEMFCCR